MKNILSNLTEKVTLLQNNEEIKSTTISRFKEIIDIRANIKAIFCSKQIPNKTYMVIIRKPPRNYSITNFSGLKWRDEIYIFKTQFQPFEKNFLKGIIEKCS